jgi:hypothetical protein
VRALKDVGNVVGAEANIKSRYGILCSDSSFSGMSVAWVGMQDDLTGISTYFSQAGYMMLRSEGWIDTFVYAEVRPVDSAGHGLFFALWNHVPPEQNSFHNYEAFVDPRDGFICFRLDGAVFFSAWSEVWIDKAVRYASWTGEIAGRETDMPGTADNKCEFNDCRFTYRDATTPTDANFGEPGDLLLVTHENDSSLPDEWGIWADIGHNTIRIWDIFPFEE